MAYISVIGGLLFENCHVLYDEETKAAAVIDPGFVTERLLDVLKPLDVQYILLTHGHFDHLMGAEALREMTGAPVCAYEAEKALCESPVLNASSSMLREPVACTVDRVFTDGETFLVGGIQVEVLHTPGHTAGGCCYRTEEVIFTGDTLMKNGVGRTDLPTGDGYALLRSLKRLAALPGDPDICSGHGRVTTLSAEKQQNPYLR